MELVNLRRLRTLRNYLTELRNAGVSLGYPGYYEYQYFKAFCEKHMIFDPFIEESQSFDERLCRFLNETYMLNIQQINAIDALCTAVY